MKFFKYLIISFLFFTLVASKNQHEYYVTVTQVEYSENEKSLQIISQIFIDDFETLLRQRYNDTITLSSETESKLTEDYMQRYYESKLQINLNGLLSNFNFLGKEYKDDMVFSYIEIENVTKLKSLEITNKLLLDIFPKQQNIVRVKIKAKNKSFLLYKENESCVLNFD